MAYQLQFDRLHRYNTMVYFAERTDFPRNVLGQPGWLDRVRVGLVNYDGHLYLSPY